MEKIDPSIFAFMCSCIVGMGTFSFWLVKKIIVLTKDCSETMKDVRHAVTNNTEAIKNLQTTIISINK